MIYSKVSPKSQGKILPMRFLFLNMMWMVIPLVYDANGIIGFLLNCQLKRWRVITGLNYQQSDNDAEILSNVILATQKRANLWEVPIMLLLFLYNLKILNCYAIIFLHGAEVTVANCDKNLSCLAARTKNAAGRGEGSNTMMNTRYYWQPITCSHYYYWVYQDNRPHFQNTSVVRI